MCLLKIPGSLIIDIDRDANTQFPCLEKIIRDLGKNIRRTGKIIPQIIFPVKDRMFGVCNDVLLSTKL
jgi:hypothetical protein